MKLFTFLITALISKIASSANCKNPELKCIELCCGLTKFYEDEFEHCEDIPEDAKAPWYDLLTDNNSTLEFVVYGMCEISDDPFATIPSCYSPYYNTTSKDLVLERLLNVPCTRLEEFFYAYIIPGLISTFVLPLCLPIMVVYTCRKGLKEKRLSFKLVFWYLVTMTMYFLATIVKLWYRNMSTEPTELPLMALGLNLIFLGVKGYKIMDPVRSMNPVTATIPSCYSPYYNTTSKDLVLERLLNVPCTRLEEFFYAYIIPGLISTFVLPLCLPIMVVYTCRKGLKEKRLSFKLVFWYLVTMTMYFLATIVKLWYRNMSTEPTDVFVKYAKILVHFFFNSTCLWHNVIGYQIWSGYKKGNCQVNYCKDRRRFICYSIYVWGIAAITASLELVFLGKSLGGLYAGGTSQLVTAVYNMVAFLVMSVNICLIRCRVVNLTNEVRFKTKLVYIICHLCLMMGIPRMLLMITTVFVETNQILRYATYVLEPFVIFIVLVLKPKNVFKCYFRCCWYDKTENIPHLYEIVYTNTNITNLSSLTEQNGTRTA